MLAKEREKRYAKASELVTDLKNLLKDLGIGGIPWRKGWFPYAAAVLVAVVGLGVLWLKGVGKGIKTIPTPEPVSVLVADFENRTGDPVFDGALEDSLSLGLEGAAFVSSFKRKDAHALAKTLNPSTQGRLDEEMALLICTREGIDLFLLGAIELDREGYIVKVFTTDTAEPGHKKQFERRADNKGAVLNAAAWLAHRIREDLGDRAADASNALAAETFTTDSLEAMQAYSRAQEFLKNGDQNGALEEYRNAIDADPEMGRAYSGMGLIYFNRGRFEEGEKYFNEAWSSLDRMTEREKLRTRGIYYLMKRDYQNAIQDNKALAEKYPADSAGHINLALSYFFARDYNKAKEAAVISVEIYPEDPMPHYNLSWYALADGDQDLAEKEASAAIDSNPDYYEAYTVLALSYLMSGNTQKAREACLQQKTLGKEGESLGSVGLADISCFEGDPDSAVTILEEQINQDLEDEDKILLAGKYAFLSKLYLELGENAKSLDRANKAVEAGSDMGTLFTTALVYIDVGISKKAQSNAELLRSKMTDEPMAYAKIIEGEIMRQSKDGQGAVNAFRESLSLLDTWYGHFILGRAYLDLEKYPEAHAELEICLKRRGEATALFFDDMPSYHIFPRVYYYYGRSQEGMNSPAAAESYESFIQIKSKSVGFPLVEDARRRLEALKR